MEKFKALLPLSLFAILLIVMGIGLRLDPSKMTSEMIDRPFPEFTQPSLYESEGDITQDVLIGKISLVNVFGSWCTACTYEHPKLMEISQQGDIQIIGINWRDKRIKGQAWLAQYGNPYAAVIFDGDSLLAIDLGISGAPETFLIDADGKIRHKHVGILTDKIWDHTFRPMITQLRQAAP